MRLSRVCVLTNPESGRGTSVRPALLATFSPAGIEWDVRTIHDPAHADDLARTAVDEGYDAVLACGGDGTIAAIASGLAGTEVPMAVLPCGTGNGFARELGLPSSVVEAAALYAEGRAVLRRFDVGRINGLTFLLRAGVGLIAEVDRGASRRMKRRLGPLAYVVGAAEALPEIGRVSYRIEGDGGLLEREAVACIIANGAALGRVEFGLGEGIAPDDGLLDALLFTGEHVRDLKRAASILGYVREAGALPPVPRLRGTRFTIDVDPPRPVVADGEDAGMTPAQVTLEEGALIALGPAPAAVTPVGRPAIAY